MAKRGGGKYTRSHGTVTAGAAQISDIAHQCEEVKKISLSIITNSKRRAGGATVRRLKIMRDGYALKLSVTDGSVHQLIYIHVTDIERAANYIKEKSKVVGFAVELIL